MHQLTVPVTDAETNANTGENSKKSKESEIMIRTFFVSPDLCLFLITLNATITIVSQWIVSWASSKPQVK